MRVGSFLRAVGVGILVVLAAFFEYVRFVTMD